MPFSKDNSDYPHDNAENGRIQITDIDKYDNPASDDTASGAGTGASAGGRRSEFGDAGTDASAGSMRKMYGDADPVAPDGSRRRCGRGRRVMRRILAFALLAVMLIGAEYAAAFCLEPESAYHYLKADIRKSKAAGKTINTIIIGDSKITDSMMPVYFDRQMNDGTVSVNAGTMGQKFDYGYYYIEDLIRRYPVKRVVLGVNYDQLKAESFSLPNILNCFLVLDRIKSPDLWLRALHNTLPMEYHAYAFKSFRYREKWKKIPETLKVKMSENYRNGVTDEYGPMGYIYYPPQGDKNLQVRTFLWSTKNDLDDYHAGYLKKTIRLCQKKGIKIELLGTPFQTSIYSTSYEDLQEAHDAVQAIADECGVTYIDMALIREQQTLFPDALMEDYEHLSVKSAPSFSAMVAALITKAENGESISDYFYDNYQSAWLGCKGIVGADLEVKREDDGSVTALVECAQNPVYVRKNRFYYYDESGQKVIIKDFSYDITCTLPEGFKSGMTLGVDIISADGDSYTYEEPETVPGS